MSQIINIRSKSNQDETFETRPCCHSSTSIDPDATTVVILKTSLNESSAHYELGSKLTASTVVLNNSVSLSAGCSDIGLRSLEVQTSRRQQNVNWNIGLNVKDKQRQTLTSSTNRDIYTLGANKSPVVRKKSNEEMRNVVSIADRTNHHQGCKSVQPAKQSMQQSFKAEKNTDCRVDIATVGRQVSNIAYHLAGTAADIANSNVNISTTAVKCTGEITCNKKTVCYNLKQATNSTSKYEDIFPCDKTVCSALRTSNCSEADCPAVKLELKIPVASSGVDCKLNATNIDRDKSKSSITSNPFSFTTSCAPDALRFRFACQSCLTVRFAVYWDLRLHEDWCGRRMPSCAGVSCQECGYRYKNLVLLHRHLVEVHGSGATAKSTLPHALDMPSNTNPYFFTTVCARDAADFPHVCASCKTVCFQQSDDLRRHEDWCGRSVSGNSTFVCEKCDASFHSDVLLKRHDNSCIEQVSFKDECWVRNRVDSEHIELCSAYQDTPVVNIESDVCRAPVNFCRETLPSIAMTYRASTDVAQSEFNHDLSLKQLEQSLLNSFCCIDCGSKFKTSQLLTKHQCSKVEHQSISGIGARHQDSKLLKINVNKAYEQSVCDVEKPSANSAKQIHNVLSIMQSKCVHCLKCHKLFNTRLLLMQHKRSGKCSATSTLAEENMCNTHNRHRKLGKVADKKDQKARIIKHPDALNQEDNVAKFEQNSSAMPTAVTLHQLESDEKCLKSGNVVECSESQEQAHMILSNVNVQHSGGDVNDTARVAEDLAYIDKSLSLNTRSIDSSDTQVAANINSGLLNTNKINKSQVMHCIPTCIGESTACKCENEPWNENCTMLSVGACSNIEPSKIESVTPDLLKSTCKPTSELATEEFKSVVVQSTIDLEKVRLLRALYLIPFEECLSPSKEPPTMSVMGTGHRKRKCILTKFDPSDLPKSPRKTGVKKISGVRNDREAVLPVSEQHIKNRPSPLKSKSKKCGAPKVKKMSKVKKESISKTKESGIKSRKQRAKSVSVVRSIRTLEPVGDNALRCVICNVLLRTIRQIIAHVCH